MKRHSSAAPPRDRVPASAQGLMLIGSIVRIAYGVGSILAPAKMVSRKLAPDTHELPEPRLLLRAFGGHQIIAGCLTLAALPSRRLARPAALLSLLIDALDVSSAVIEIGARGRSDRSLLGGIILSGAGVITFTAALRVTRRPQESPRSLAVDRPSAAGVQCH